MSKISAFLIVMTLAVCQGHSPAVAVEPASYLLRTAVVPETGIWVGQQVLFHIDVLGKNSWAQIPRIPDIQVAGVVLVPFESQGTRLNEIIDGESYTGQRYELSLFPQRSGQISIPPTIVEIQIKQWNSQVQEKRLKGKLPGVHFSAALPPGAEEIKGLVSTAKLTAGQTWEPDTKKIAVGDAVRRQIHIKAEGVSAMAFTPVAFSASDRVDVYPRSPNLHDGYNRGTLTGEKTEAVSYVFIKTGTTELPAVTVTWWDLKNKKLQDSVLPSRTFNVLPSSAAKEKLAGKTSADTRATWIFILLFVVVSILGTPLLTKRLQGQWRRWQRKRRETEKAYYRRFKKAARSGNPVDTLNRLMRWLDRIHTGRQSARLDQFLGTYSIATGEIEVARLLQATENPAKSRWEGRHLIQVIRMARKKWLFQQRKETSHRHLPNLNPGSATVEKET